MPIGRSPGGSQDDGKKELSPNMEAFWTEIEALKATSPKLKFLRINPRDLTEKDAAMWYRFKNYQAGAVTPAQFIEYQKDLNEDKESRRFFSQLFLERMQEIWTEDEIGQFNELRREEAKKGREERRREEIRRENPEG